LNLNLNISIFDFVSLNEKTFMTRQLATMLGSGLAIDQAFKILMSQTTNVYLQRVYQAVIKDLEQGVALSNALGRHRKVFDPVFIAIVRSGETSGQLDKVLMQLADRMEVTQDFNSKIRTALVYPAFIFLTMIAIIVLMMIYVIPELKSVFAESKVELPWTTKVIVAISDFTVQYWWIETIAAVILITGLYLFFKSENGGSVWDRFKITIPIIRDLYRQVYMARFCQTMAMLIKAGLPIIETLAITANVVQNRIYTQSLKRINGQVERGIPMSVPMRQDKNFPPIVSEMMAVGEQTGKMETILDKLAVYYEAETNAMIKSFSGLIEPAIIVIIGSGVGFLVYSIIYPIYSIAQIGF
jgi:type IV pilus assembly protein PilC